MGLVILQALILNNIHLAGYATPLLYIYLILKLETETSRNALMLWAFFLGLAVDILSDTPGMNASATVALAFLRPLFLRLFMSREILDNITPSIHAIGLGAFTKYMAVSAMLHHTVLFSIEFFSTAHLGFLLLRIISSTLLTCCCIIAIETMIKKK